MSDFQNQQESSVASKEVGVAGPTNPEQDQSAFVHQRIDRQLTYQDNRQYHETTIYSLPEQSYVPSGDEGSKKGIEKLKKIVGKQYLPKYDVDLSNFAISSEGFPEIYPEMFQVGFYQGMSIPNDNNYNPESQGISLTTSDRPVTIDQLVFDIQANSFVSVIGYPGSGKTTLSKRLARHLATRKDSLVLRKLFMDMNDCNKQLTLEEFLLGDCNYNLNNKEKNSIFEWITTNPENCFIILDGFDQVSWNLQEDLKTSNYNTAFKYWELLSNLCLGKFLRNCHLIFTSRPHAMLNIPQRCRPKLTCFIRDLTFENMKKLFDAFINDQQQSERFWHKLTTKTPHLLSMCHNPLMLQLYLRASLSSSHTTAHISTMTRIFHIVLLNLKVSGHAVSLSDIIVTKLSKIAYEATRKRTVLITAEDLLTENLSSDKVQDLVVTLLGANRECGLLDGQQRLYFCHQTFQEYFSALYIYREMSLPDFRSFVQGNFLNHHWSVVAQFLSGLLLDSYMNKDLSNSAVDQIPSDLMQSTSRTIPTFSQIASTSSNSRVSQQSSTQTAFQQTPSLQTLQPLPQSSFLQQFQQLNMPSNALDQSQSPSQSASSSSPNSKPQPPKLRKIFPKSSGRTSIPSSQFPPLSQPEPSSFSPTTSQVPSDESDSTPPMQNPPLSPKSAIVEKKEIFISVLCDKTREVAASHNDRSIISLSKIARESCDEELVRTTGSCFDGGRISMELSDSQNDFHAVALFLKLMPARVGMLGLWNCGMKSERFHPWVEAIKSMLGSIVRMDLSYNFLSTVDDVIEVIHKVEKDVVMWECLSGRGWWRHPNSEELSRMQEALDRLENKKLEIDVGDGRILKHKDAAEELSDSDGEESDE